MSDSIYNLISVPDPPRYVFCFFYPVEMQYTIYKYIRNMCFSYFVYRCTSNTEACSYTGCRIPNTMKDELLFVRVVPSFFRSL